MPEILLLKRGTRLAVIFGTIVNPLLYETLKSLQYSYGHFAMFSRNYVIKQKIFFNRESFCCQQNRFVSIKPLSRIRLSSLAK